MHWDNQTVRGVFIGTWIALFFAFTVWRFAASPEFKRKTHAPLMVLIGILFLLFIFLLNDGENIGFVAVTVVAITALNIWSVRYCPECGAMAYRPFARPEFCSRCGAPLDGSRSREAGSKDLRRR